MSRTRTTASFEDEDLAFLRELRGIAIASGREVHFPDVLHAALEVARAHRVEVQVALVARRTSS